MNPHRCPLQRLFQLKDISLKGKLMFLLPPPYDLNQAGLWLGILVLHHLVRLSMSGVKMPFLVPYSNSLKKLFPPPALFSKRNLSYLTHSFYFGHYVAQYSHFPSCFVSHCCDSQLLFWLMQSWDPFVD